MTKQEKKFFWLGMLFILPWIIGFLCFQVYPIISAGYYSLTDYNVFQEPNFIGFQNYIDLFQDQKFPLSLWNTAFMAIIGLPIGLFFALLIALLLNQSVKGMPFFRTLYYMPTVVPMVASAMLFIWVLNPESGLINSALKLFGISGPSWLRDPAYTKWALIIMDTWRCGQSAIIFLAALKAVPKPYYEAAQIDGAGAFRRFISITVPSIAPTIQFLVVMGLIQSFQYFTQGFIFTTITGTGQSANGGPADSMLFYSLYLYQQGFSYLKMGYACAMAIVLFIIVLSITLFVFRILESNINYDQE